MPVRAISAGMLYEMFKPIRCHPIVQVGAAQLQGAWIMEERDVPTRTSCLHFSASERINGAELSATEYETREVKEPDSAMSSLQSALPNSDSWRAAYACVASDVL